MAIKTKTIENAMHYGLMLFAFSLCLSVTFTEIGFLISLVSLMIMSVKTNYGNLKNIYPTIKIIIIAWLIYIAAGIISSLLGVEPLQSFKYMKKDLTRFSAFLTLVFSVPYQTDKNIKNIISVYILGALIASITGIFEVLIHFLKHGSLIIATGTMNRIFYGEVLAVAAGLALTKSNEGNKHSRIFFLISSIFIIFALILSQARGPLLGFITIVFISVILNKDTRKSVILTCVISILLPFIILTAQDVNYKTRMLSIRNGIIRLVKGDIPENPENTVAAESVGETKSSFKIDTSAAIRLTIWKIGIKIIKDYPVFGVGPRMLGKYFYGYYPHRIENKPEWNNLHNLYLQQAAERGLLGLSALLFLMFLMLYKSFQFFKKTFSPYSIIAVSTMCGFFVMNLTQTSFQHAVISMSVFFIFSLSLREVLVHDNLNSNYWS